MGKRFLNSRDVLVFKQLVYSIWKIPEIQVTLQALQKDMGTSVVNMDDNENAL